MTTYRTATLTVHHMGSRLELCWAPAASVTYLASVALVDPSESIAADMVLALLPLECPEHLVAHAEGWRDSILALLAIVNDSAWRKPQH